MTLKRFFKRSQNPAVLPFAACSADASGVVYEEVFEETLHFLVFALAERPRRGKKPVVLHSLRVAQRLMASGYDIDVVVAGLLHDLLEKTSISAETVTHNFGVKVGVMVLAMTNDPTIANALERYRDSVRRCAAVGEGALAIRACDLLDNCDRQMQVAGPARLARLAEKLRVVLEVREELANDQLTSELQRRQRRLLGMLKGEAVSVAKTSTF